MKDRTFVTEYSGLRVGDVVYPDYSIRDNVIYFTRKDRTIPPSQPMIISKIRADGILYFTVNGKEDDKVYNCVFTRVLRKSSYTLEEGLFEL